MASPGNMWKEVETAKNENRRELILTGPEILARINDNGFDENLFNLSQLNFLEISKVGLLLLSEKIGQLTNLTNLVLCHNKLSELPSSVGKLLKLRLLDVSNNCLTALPNEVSQLKELHVLNANCNKLGEFVDVSRLSNLHVLDLSHNNLTKLPDGINSCELSSFQNLAANDNKITLVPDDLCDLPSLKVLDLSNNLIDALPAELGECGKLKDFKCTGNKLKDKRLLKLVNQCSTKAILDYLKTQKPKESGSKKEEKTKKHSKNKHQKGGNAAAEDENVKNIIKVFHFDTDGGNLVKIMPQALNIRPFIVCCIVRNLDFSKSSSMMRRFIALQTRLHDVICVKRQLATIATHDLEKMKFPIIYDAKEPSSIKIQPLNKLKEVTAQALVARLRKEAEDLRKEKKRNAVSGIHKYLNLLKDDSLYPCIVDDTGCVISFPPIVNSNVTKVTRTTRNIFIEITGSQNLDICKKTMDQMLINLLKMGLGQEEEVSPKKDVDAVTKDMESRHIAPASGDAKLEDHEDNQNSECQADGDNEDDEGKEEFEFDEEHQVANGDGSSKILIVEQVKVVDHLNNLKIVYPSRVDLQSDQSNQSFKVIRNFE